MAEALILNDTLEPGIVRLTFNRPDKLNALSDAMVLEFEAALDAIAADRAVRAVILTGGQARAFCVGADINAWAALQPLDMWRQWVRRGHQVFDQWAGLRPPVIAAINGHAFGGGLELAITGDIRLAAADAIFALPEASISTCPGWSGTQRLARLLPEPMLKEMALFGRRIGADRCLAVGFVAEVAEDPLAVAEAMATRVAELSPRAVEIAKAMIHAARDEDAGAMIEALGGAAIAASDDRAEGVQAFREKRKPKFPGH